MSKQHNLKPYIIEENKDISKIIKKIRLNSKNTVFVFDIHKTTLDKDGNPNIEVKKYVKLLLKNNYNVLFLSFDGNGKRIIENNKNVNKISEYQNIPKLFIKKRNKHLVLKELCKVNTFHKRIKYKAILIDDNINNIRDVKKLNRNSIIGYYYTKYNRYEGNNNLSNLGKKFNIFKLSKKKIKSKKKTTFKK